MPDKSNLPKPKSRVNVILEPETENVPVPVGPPMSPLVDPDDGLDPLKVTLKGSVLLSSVFVPCQFPLTSQGEALAFKM